MRIRRTTFGAVLVLTLWTGMTIGGPWTLFLPNPTGREDSKTNDEGKTYKEQKRSPEYVPVEVAFFRNLFRAFDAAHDDINVLSTIAVAIFTFTLWRSTDKLYEAGERQIAVAQKSVAAAERSARTAERALMGAEAPYLFPAFEHRPPKDNEEWPTLGTIALIFGNLGRGPALIRGSHITIVSAKQAPDPFPVAGSYFRFEHILPANTQQQLGIIAVGTGTEITETKATAETRTLPMFVNGYVRYADFTGMEYVTEVCFLYDPRKGRLHGLGPERNRRRQLDDAEIKSGTTPVIPL